MKQKVHPCDPAAQVTAFMWVLLCAGGLSGRGVFLFLAVNFSACFPVFGQSGVSVE